MNKTIVWTSKLVDIKLIKKTPKNYKIKNDLGRKRLQASLKSFGIAGNVIVNTDYTLIDGNSRLEEELNKGSKKIYVSMPSRKLTPAEFKEMSAIFDYAKAGDVDIEEIQRDLGTTKKFFDKYSMSIPMGLLEKMGKKAKIQVDEEDLEYDEDDPKASKPVGQFRMVSLYFTEKQEKQFRDWEDKLMKKFKTDSTTDTVFAALKHMMK